jgi:hypothetical protein
VALDGNEKRKIVVTFPDGMKLDSGKDYWPETLRLTLEDRRRACFLEGPGQRVHLRLPSEIQLAAAGL